MDHVVYVDAKAKELDNILLGQKTMIIRGAAGRKVPYGRVSAGDVLYFIQNNGEGLVRAKANVQDVFNSEKMTMEESAVLVDQNQLELQLSAQQTKRWAGKRYLVLIRIADPVKVEPFEINKSEYGNMDDWLPVEDIDCVRCN
jgi:hypothetical protein